MSDLTPHVLNVYTHIGFGVGALGMGLAPILSAKGGRFHRAAGRVFAWLTLVVLATALIGIVFFNPPAALVAAFVAATYQYLGGLRALQLKDRGPGWLDALLALAGLGACVALFVFMGPGTPSWTPALGYSIIGFTLLIVVYDLSRHFWREAWLKHARHYDHGIKLTGSYFAMMSAGVGNVFRDWQPWSQVGPSAVGTLVMIVLAVAYATRKSRVRAPA